jgi:hypothetical protein
MLKKLQKEHTAMQKEFDKAKKAKLVEEEKKKGYRYQKHFFFFLNVPAKP